MYVLTTSKASYLLTTTIVDPRIPFIKSDNRRYGIVVFVLQNLIQISQKLHYIRKWAVQTRRRHLVGNPNRHQS